MAEIQELYQAFLEAQGRYAGEVQRFGHSARPNMDSLLRAGELERAARKAYMEAKRMNQHD